MTPDRALLALGLTGGLLFVFATPPFQAPDEIGHFRRAYQISEGVLFPRAGGETLPESVVRLGEGFWADLAYHPERRVNRGTFGAALALPLSPERRTAAWLGGSILSTPAPYLPQAFAAFLGRSLGLRPLVLFYLCRLANLAAGLALAWAAIRISPSHRWLFVFLALDPMALFLRSSLSPDATIDAAALLLVALVLALRMAPSEPPRGRFALLLGTVAFLALAKGASYLLLPAMALLIPVRSFRGGRQAPRIAFLAALAVLVLAGAEVSTWAVRRAYVPLRPEVGADPAAQVAWISHHPVRFAGIAALEALRHAPRDLSQLVGKLGWLDTPLPIPLVLGYALLLLALALFDGSPDLVLGLPARLLLAAIAAGTVLAVYAGQYLLWSPVGAGYIEGVQGRYFLPLAPAASLLLQNRRWARDLSGPGMGRWLFAISAAAILVTLLTVLARYYG